MQSKTAKRRIKGGIGAVVRFMPFARQSLEQALTVFVFHDVTDQPSPFDRDYGLAVSCGTFERQVAWISANFTVVHPRVLLERRPLPRRAALISFDDGFRGSFANGLEILRRRKIPSIFFLNMRGVIEQKPILSAVACYLDRFVPAFARFAATTGLKRPFHLTLTPAALEEFERQHGAVEVKAAAGYQGEFTDVATVEAWCNPDEVIYGNHLYEHWNAAALTAGEFREQYRRNAEALSGLKNPSDMFAFPNGHPGSCFSDAHLAELKLLGSQKTFSATGGVNDRPDAFLLGRVALTENESSPNQMWFRVGRALVSRKQMQIEDPALV